MRLIITLAMLCFFCAGVSAQDGIYGSLNIGSKMVDLENLNSWLNSDLTKQNLGDFGEFNTNTFTIGGGGYVIIAKRFLLGGKGQIMLPQVLSDDNNIKLKLNGGAGEATLGFVLLSHAFRLYPYVGVGLSGFMLQRLDTLPAVTDNRKFEDVLADDRQSVIQRGGLITDAGVALDLYLKTIKLLSFIKGLETGPFIGIQAGYYMLPIKTHWMRDDKTVENNPAIKWDGLYIEAKIGLGFSSGR
ncbi:MAG: hypothetical protein ABIA63_08595 [bacterium]